MCFAFLAAISLSAAIVLSIGVVSKLVRVYEWTGAALILAMLYGIGIVSTFAFLDIELSKSIGESVAREMTIQEVFE